MNIIDAVAIQLAEVADRFCDSTSLHPGCGFDPHPMTAKYRHYGAQVTLEWFGGEILTVILHPRYVTAKVYGEDLDRTESWGEREWQRRKVRWHDPLLGEKVAALISRLSGRPFPADWMEWSDSDFTNADDALGRHDDDLFSVRLGDHDPEWLAPAGAEEPAELAPHE